MNRLAFALALLLLTTSALADGLVTTSTPVPNHWRVGGVSFTIGGESAAANVFVDYLFPDGKVDHAAQVHIVGADRLGLIAATSISSGSDEANLTITNPDETTRPDLDAILVLRISRFLIAHGYLTGVTAVPTASSTGQ
jgi:hypothetical protein